MKSVFSFLRHVIWRIRVAANFGCASGAELRYRILRLPNLSAPGRFFTFPWGRMEFVSASDLRGQFFEIFEQRHYAFKTAVAAPVIIDAGGNIGMSAIWFRQTYPQCNLTVYEADPTLAGVLARNLAAAKISGVNVQNAAVWTEDGTVAFDNLGQDKGAVSSTGAIQVRAIDLARHLPERVDLLKLDVEGAEYAIVEKLCRDGSIARVQNLVAEYHVRRPDLDRFLASLRLLREAGLQVTFSSALGPWLGRADATAKFEIVGDEQMLAEVYAWR